MGFDCVRLIAEDDGSATLCFFYKTREPVLVHLARENLVELARALIDRESDLPEQEKIYDFAEQEGSA